MGFDHTVEACKADAWKFRFDDPDTVVDHLRESVELDVDTDNMLLFHRNNIKISFVPRSGVLMVRTTNRKEAETIVEELFPA